MKSPCSACPLTQLEFEFDFHRTIFLSSHYNGVHFNFIVEFKNDNTASFVFPKNRNSFSTVDSRLNYLSQNICLRSPVISCLQSLLELKESIVFGDYYALKSESRCSVCNIVTVFQM